MLFRFVMDSCAIGRIGCARFSSFLIGLALTLAAASSASALPPQTPAAVADSAEGLQSQIEAILDAAKKKDSKQYDDLIDGLKVPEGADWFSATFGVEDGPKVAANYRNSWAAYREQLSRMFQETGKSRPKRVFVKQFLADSPPTQNRFLQAVIRNVKDSVAFYTAGTGKDKETSTLPGVYVYVQGCFRILNWRAFYGLPGVKPVRVRLGTAEAVRQILYQVNPEMSDDARKQHVQGTVFLRMVIDCDGNVVQLQPISGPESLMQRAQEAVRQWRFRPLLLNGDPVEVDTMVSIAFSFAQ